MSGGNWCHLFVLDLPTATLAGSGNMSVQVPFLPSPFIQGLQGQS